MPSKGHKAPCFWPPAALFVKSDAIRFLSIILLLHLSRGIRAQERGFGPCMGPERCAATRHRAGRGGAKGGGAGGRRGWRPEANLALTGRRSGGLRGARRWPRTTRALAIARLSRGPAPR